MTESPCFLRLCRPQPDHMTRQIRNALRPADGPAVAALHKTKKPKEVKGCVAAIIRPSIFIAHLD